MKQKWSVRKLVVPLLAAFFLLGAGESFAKSKIRLKVRNTVKSEEDRTHKTVQDSYGDDITITTELAKEVCTLKVNIRQSGDPLTSCRIEWYFLSEHVKNARDSGETVIFSPGSKELSFGDSVSLEENIVSTPFVLKTITSTYANSSDKISGDTYEGYIVLVTQGGEILAQASNSSRYLNDEWLAKCRQAAVK